MLPTGSWRLLSLLLAVVHQADSIKLIKNGLAAPEIVHSPVSMKPRCIVQAAPLDLIFVLDSSGSLRNQFQDEIDIIRRIVRHVTIGKDATRVMLVQFSGIQHLEFGLNRFTTREEILAALDGLRHVSGITRIGGALEFTRKAMNPDNGLRDSSVPKIVYILSDGRTHDFPKDWEEAEKLRRAFTPMDIWAYGTGEYVATPALMNYTNSAAKIITNKNLPALEQLFDAWKGTEICDKVPLCVKGSDAPLDLTLLIDASESVDRLFDQQIQFAIERIIQNVNIHPEATRLTLISYSGKVFTHFTFNKYLNNTDVVRHLNTLRSIKGTTSTHLALEETLDYYTVLAKESGARDGATKLVIVLTDGHSRLPPGPVAQELRSKNVTLIAISVTAAPYVDEYELKSIAGSDDRVFTPSNMQDFEVEFFKYVGFGCMGMEIAADSITFTIRTQREMEGIVYAARFDDSQECRTAADGSSREVRLHLAAGTCGVEKIPSPNGAGYTYNATIVLQFHPLIQTRSDQSLSLSCFFAAPVARIEVARSIIKPLSATRCTYTMHKYAPDQCVALDAKVGESLHHKWECDNAANYRYLVHDCVAQGSKHGVKFIDSNGCEMDEHLLETPDYNRFTRTPLRSKDHSRFVHQEMSVFKFPGDDVLAFECSVSFCDMESDAPCTDMIPPKCSPKKRAAPSDDLLRRAKRATSAQKPGFLMTMPVTTRTLNIVPSESMRVGRESYCQYH